MRRETAEALTEETTRRTAELEVARAALKATQSVALSVQNRYARLGAERVHRTLEQNRRDRVASAFRSWVDAGSKPEVSRTRISRCAVARPEDFTTPSANSGVQNGPPPPVALETREAAVNTLDVAEEGETARPAPQTPTRSVLSNAGAKEDRQHAINETGANTEPKAPVLISVSGNNQLGSNQRLNPWSDQVDGALTPVTASRGKVENESRDHDVGGFPFPVIAPSPAHSITPSTAPGRPAPVTEDVNASLCNSASGVSVPVARPGGGGRSANPDPPRVMLALRAAVGNELYAVGERLLRCIEADHREVQGKAYRPIPVTGAERDQFLAYLQDATRGPLRRTVLRFLRVQESYRAVAVERDREGAERSREERRVGHGLGGGGDGGGVRDARRKSRDKQCIEENQYEVSSLMTGPLSSPAEKARAARYGNKQNMRTLHRCSA